MNLENELLEKLAPLLRRYQWITGVSKAIHLFAFATLAALVLSIPWPVTTYRQVLIDCLSIAGLSLVTLVIVRSIPVSPYAICRKIDHWLQSKDQISSSLFFLKKNETTPIEELQIRQSIQLLESVKGRECFPFVAPSSWQWGVAFLSVLFALPLVQSSFFLKPAEATNSPAILMSKADLPSKELLQEIAKIESLDPVEDEEDSSRELAELAEKLEQPQRDPKETLANISEMEQALENTLAKLSVEQVESQLKQVADALKLSKELESVGESLEKGEYEEAAKLLEQSDLKNMSELERKSVTEKLEEVAEDLKRQGNEKLAEAADELKEAVAQSEKGSASKAQKMVGQIREQGEKQSLSEKIDAQLNQLAELKSSQSGNEGGAEKSGGDAANKSNSSKTTFGFGVSGNPLGNEKTSMKGNLNREELKGIQGEGESEKETVSADPTEQESTREYQRRLVEFRQQMEGVLDKENLPLGHRATVRRYFDSIRPNEKELEQVSK